MSRRTSPPGPLSREERGNVIRYGVASTPLSCGRGVAEGRGEVCPVTQRRLGRCSTHSGSRCRPPQTDTEWDKRARQPAGDDAAPETDERWTRLPGGEPKAEADCPLRLGWVEVRVRRGPWVVA